MNRRAFQKLASARVFDAKVLLKAKRFDAAYYLAGYSVECALKACVAKNTRKFDFPPRDTNKTHYSHDLEGLVKLARIERPFAADRQRDATLDRNWDVVKSSRYRQSARESGRG
jgi:hypothetical protein